MSSIIGFIKRIYTGLNPPVCQAVSTAEHRPLKFGVLGAATIAPIAIVAPVKNHPETILYAVAARDKAKAAAFARKHGFEKAYGGPNGYQELIDDPEIDAIYNPLPNGLHYEWTMKALAAGKHVLLEKPSADTAEETRQMFDLAEKKGLVLLEAFHYRFHPAIQRAKAIIDSNELGRITHLSAALAVPSVIGPKPSDIRYDYALGGGGLMDMGCYALNAIRYLSSSDPTSVVSAEHSVFAPAGAPPSFRPNIDRRTTATLALPHDVTASLVCDLGMPPRYGFVPPMPLVHATVTLERGEIAVYNFVMPTLYHSIKVTAKEDARKKTKTRVEKVYTFADGEMEGKGEAWWTTYRFQLEAFVDRVKGRPVQTWVDREDSIANMHWIEQIYAKVCHALFLDATAARMTPVQTGLGSRPKSQYVPPQSE